MSTREPTEQEIVEAILAFTAEQIQNGTPGFKIEQMLVERGLDQETASTVVADVRRMRREALQSHAKKNMLYGALWCIGGIVITVVSYGAAASGSGGGTYVVTWGAVIFGAVQFIRGVIQLNEH